MKKATKRLFSLLLAIMMLVTMFPVSAFAAESEDAQPVLDSGAPGPKHWLQQYQEYAMSQISKEASGPRKARADFGSASPHFTIISWAGGEENRLIFANGAYLGDGMPKISLNGKVAFCAEWNGVAPEGDYIQSGSGNDPAIKQILANYDNSGKSNADYCAAQAAIWAHLMGTSVVSWGACPGAASEDEIFNGTADYDNIKYNYITWSGGTQKILTYDNDDEPFVPPDDDGGKYRVEVKTDTSTETEVRNQKTYSYSDALGQITIRKHDQDEKSLDGALFDIDVAFSDGSHTTVNGWEVDNGARLFTWVHPQDNHDPATVTVREVKAPRGYLMDPRPQTAVVAPTYTRVTHVETWTVTIVTETTSSTVIEIETGNVVAESSSSSSAETESDPQVEEFTDFVEGDRETTMTFVNQAMPCSLTIYKHETGNKSVALEGASFRIRYADTNVSSQTWTETTDRNGEIYIALPYAGSLIVEELSAPAGYVMSAKTTYDVTVAKGEQKVLDIPNDKKTQLVVVKKDAQTGQLLAGATIKATLLRSNTPPFEAGQSFTETTGPDGKAVFSNLIPGEYRVEETAPPQYYQGTSQVHTVNIPEGNSETITVEFRNEPWTGLTIRKVDKTNAKGLPGAIFKLYKGSKQDSKAYLGDWESGENGSVTIQKLEPGYYTIVEAQAPHGYLLDEEHQAQTIEIKPDAVGKNMTVVFQNLPKPRLLIEKVDAETGIRLPGAVFRVARRGSSEYLDVTTGADGAILLENLENDWYTVTEIKAPNGYILEDRHYDVEMIPGKTVPLIVNNYRQPDLLLRKVDEQTGAGLSGAVLRVTKDGAKEYRDITTGADGTCTLQDLTPGWYIVEEIKAPGGYILDSVPQYIEVKEGQDTELVIKNQHKPSLEILKIDSVTRQPIGGVTFKVQVKNGKTLGEYTTNAAGRICLEDIDPALYTVTEVAAPKGYIMATGSKEALVEWGKVVSLQFENQPRNPILVKKVDAKTGEPLAGAKFLIQEVNGAFVAELETGRNGYITVTDLDPGWYTVKETKAPIGYILDDTPKTVELKSDTPAVVEFENQPLNGLHIKKVDPSGAPLSGAKFRVNEKTGRFIGDYDTDSQGDIVVDNLQPGWYTIQEIKAPEGYRLDNTPKDVEFVWGQFVTVEFTNNLLSPIQIRKVDAKTGAPLARAGFRVTKANGEYVGDFTTGIDGFLNVPELEPGFYIISEVKAPEGYQLDNTPQTVEVRTNVPTVIEFPNNRLPGLQVQKIDKVTKEPLAGAKFRVEKVSGEKVGDFTTNSAGFFALSDLEAGAYAVYEAAAPAGYILDNTPQTVELKPNQTVSLEFSNKPLAGLQIKKVDAVTGQPLKGVEFRVTNMDNSTVGTYTTDEAGLIFVPDLAEGWYIVTETCALDGYKPDSAPRNVQVVSGKLNLVEYKNLPYPVLEIVKVDSETKEPIEGVSFKLADRCGRELGTFTTNRLGQIHLTGMEQGTYQVQEIEATPGYVLDSTVRAVDLLWGKVTKLEVPNTPMGTLIVRKVDAETKQPLFGAVFNLYDLRNNLLGEYTTDNRGIIEFPKEIKAGRYKLKEVKAPDGYVLDETPKTIEVKSGETTEVTIENQPMRGKIQIIKKAADDNPITKDKAGALLEGATFEVYNEKLEVVDTITTDSKGVATTKDLPLGTYGVKEVKAPKHYILDGKVFYATLKVHDDLVRFEVLNTSEDVSVSVEKRGNQEVLAGQIMSYDFSNIRNDSNVALDEFYLHDSLPDAVRLGKIVTGTWSERLTYDITYRTNKKDSYRTLASNLSSKTSHTLDCGREALDLAAGEYVTDIQFEFGTVQPGFHEETKPTIYVTTLTDLKSGYRIINRVEAGGRTGDEWVTAKDSWITVVWGKSKGKLPKTGI